MHDLSAMLACAKCIRTQADAGGEVLMLVRSKGLRHDVGKVLMSGDLTFRLAWRSRQTWNLISIYFDLTLDCPLERIVLNAPLESQ